MVQLVTSTKKKTTTKSEIFKIVSPEEFSKFYVDTNASKNLLSFSQKYKWGHTKTKGQ